MSNSLRHLTPATMPSTTPAPTGPSRRRPRVWARPDRPIPTLYLIPLTFRRSHPKLTEAEVATPITLMLSIGMVADLHPVAELSNFPELTSGLPCLPPALLHHPIMLTLTSSSSNSNNSSDLHLAINHHLDHLAGQVAVMNWCFRLIPTARAARPSTPRT